MLVLNENETAALIDRDALREAVGVAMAEVSGGRVSMPPRVGAFRDDPMGVMAAMLAYVPALGAMATKIVNVFPANAERDLPTHRAIVLMVDPETGTFEAMVDGEVITAERTAACSALSVELLSRPDSAVLAILGTGVQARSHALAVTRVRAFDEVRVAGRNRERAEALVQALEPELAVPLVVADDFEAACAEADVVCATTDSPEPVVQRSWLAPGTHVASVGFAAGGPEIDAATVVDAYVVVESRATAFAGYPVGPHDLRGPLQEGLITEDHVAAEIGELVSGAVALPSDPARLTLYKSAGLAAQDVVAVKLIVEAARRAGVGTMVG